MPSHYLLLTPNNPRLISLLNLWVILLVYRIPRYGDLFLLKKRTSIVQIRNLIVMLSRWLQQRLWAISSISCILFYPCSRYERHHSRSYQNRRLILSQLSFRLYLFREYDPRLLQHLLWGVFLNACPSFCSSLLEHRQKWHIFQRLLLHIQRRVLYGRVGFDSFEWAIWLGFRKDRDSCSKREVPIRPYWREKLYCNLRRFSSIIID